MEKASILDLTPEVPMTPEVLYKKGKKKSNDVTGNFWCLAKLRRAQSKTGTVERFSWRTWRLRERNGLKAMGKEIAYPACFGAKKGCLSMDKGAYFDENV